MSGAEIGPERQHPVHMPFEFQREHDGSLPVESAVFQALGAASMCWSETPKGIFDSTRAKEIGDKLLEFLGHPQTNPYAGVLLSPQQKDAMEEMKDAQGNKIFAPRDSLRFGEDL